MYSTLQCSRPYAGADESLCTYLECLREDLLHGRLDEFGWVPTASMLADGGSKVMDDVLAAKLMSDGSWYPSDHKLLLRANMDGADTIDRQRLRQTHDVDTETPERDPWDGWFNTPTGTEWDLTGAWMSGDIWLPHGQERAPGLTGFAGGGCGGTCPFCTGKVYEESEDLSPLTFWTSETT